MPGIHAPRPAVRRTVLAAGTLAAALLGGCGADHAGMGHGMSAPAAGSSSVTSFNDTDVMFIQMMIPHHQQAVRMSDLAVTRAGDARVKELAAQIKAEQRPEIATMLDWLDAFKQPTLAPTGMDMGHGPDHGAMAGMATEAQLKALSQASGTPFDKMFLTLMIAHHQGALTMADQELVDGTNPLARQLAQQVVNSQSTEIATMRSVLDRL
ncbi:DUF305 domain-containing protein [Catellatospora sp. TT07R-123]|uniref:DUF305 domain-containing protein n=1 Tax=Catellatospora sp. TT07R-123 TaxID=2733863 RepID=UPI001B01AEF8|nr:DUF305 domain-containing protein [Catellatospora sp. TT07R-123]GHJ48140.1 DUF305 domain-containing protein [Catellatospora sp. TT07R-123]